MRVLALALLVPLQAFAQSPPPDDYTLLGVGVRSRPAYDGSASQTADLIPVVRYYGKPLFARTTQGILEGGARAEVAPGLALGAQIAYEAGRKKSESGFLRERNVPDIAPGASVGVHAEWDTKLGPAPPRAPAHAPPAVARRRAQPPDRKSTHLNSRHQILSSPVLFLQK